MVLVLGCNETVPENESLECPFDIDTLDFSFGIRYDDPSRYTHPGEQSTLADSFAIEIQNRFDTPEPTLKTALAVCHWANQTFSYSNAGGAMIGTPDVNDLFEDRTFYGCHSLALIIASTLRELGFPTVMIETAGIQWAYDYRDGQTQSFSGHVMNEVFVDTRWILLDNNCTFVRDYDPLNPFIPMPSNSPYDYFVFAKGQDFWDYSDGDSEFTHREMIAFTEYLPCYEVLFETVTYTWSN